MKRHSSVEVLVVLLVLVAASCGQASPPQAAPEELASPEGSPVSAALRGRIIHLVDGSAHPESFTSEIFGCTGQWQTSGAGHSDQSGSFRIENDILCVEGQGDYALCRRVELVSSDTVRLHGAEPRQSAASLYRIDPQSEPCD